MEKNLQKAVLPGYYQALKDEKAKEHYKAKLEFVSGSDPYEIRRGEWEDDVDLWPEVTHIHIGMYLLLTPSPYAKAFWKMLPNIFQGKNQR